MALTLLGMAGDVTDVEPKTRNTAANAPPADLDPWCTYAQVDVGGMRIAIATEHVRQALPRPPSMVRLPRSRGALEGVFKLRGQVVPVVDLRGWMGLPTDARPPHIMVLGSERRVVGLAIDAIHGLLRLRASRVQAIHHDEDSDGFFHSVLSTDGDAELISVLDPVRLMNQALAWADERPDTSPTAPAQGGHPMPGEATTRTPLQALTRLGPVVLGAPATAVREVLPLPPLQRLFGRGGKMWGLVRWRDVDVPVLDPDQVLGLPLANPPNGRRLLIILATGTRCVGVPVDEVLAVRGFPCAQVQAASETGMAQAQWFVGSTTLDSGERAFLLNSDAVVAKFGLTVHADGEPTSGDGQTKDTACDADRAHIVFDMGQLWAAAMDMLQEITPFPTDFTPGKGADPATVGTFEWRGKTLPVLDLRNPIPSPLVGQAADGMPAPKLMVVQARQRTAALVVNDVVALLAPRQGIHTRVTLAGGACMHLITVGHPPERKSHRVLDFSTLPFFCSD